MTITKIGKWQYAATSKGGWFHFLVTDDDLDDMGIGSSVYKNLKIGESLKVSIKIEVIE